MYGGPFDQLLTGSLSSRVVWEKASRCPCVLPDGTKDRKCAICGGIGRYWAAPSVEFRVGLVSLSAKALAAIQQKFGPGMIGDSTASIPGNAPCWASVWEGDRFTALDALDPVEWTLSPGNPIHLPYLAVVSAVRIRTPDLLAVLNLVPSSPEGLAVLVPEPGGRVSVTVPAVVVMTAPRRYEVVKDLAQIRTFGEGLPKKVLLKLIDWTVR